MTIDDDAAAQLPCPSPEGGPQGGWATCATSPTSLSGTHALKLAQAAPSRMTPLRSLPVIITAGGARARGRRSWGGSRSCSTAPPAPATRTQTCTCGPGGRAGGRAGQRGRRWGAGRGGGPLAGRLEGSRQHRFRMPLPAALAWPRCQGKKGRRWRAACGRAAGPCPAPVRWSLATRWWVVVVVDLGLAAA